MSRLSDPSVRPRSSSPPENVTCRDPLPHAPIQQGPIQSCKPAPPSPLSDQRTGLRAPLQVFLHVVNLPQTLKSKIWNNFQLCPLTLTFEECPPTPLNHGPASRQLSSLKQFKHKQNISGKYQWAHRRTSETRSTAANMQPRARTELSENVGVPQPAGLSLCMVDGAEIRARVRWRRCPSLGIPAIVSRVTSTFRSAGLRCGHSHLHHLGEVIGFTASTL